MSEKPGKEIVIIKESLREQIARDAVTLLTFTGMIGLGVVIGSEAMQWIGGIVFLLVLVGRSNAFGNRHTFTLEEAQDHIEFLIAGRDGIPR